MCEEKGVIKPTGNYQSFSIVQLVVWFYITVIILLISLIQQKAQH